MMNRPADCRLNAVLVLTAGFLTSTAIAPAVAQAPPLLVPPTALEPPPGTAVSPGRTVVASAEPAEAFTPSPEFQEWITRLVRDHLPHEYEKKKNWGNTTRTFDGVSVRLEDGRIKTHRKFKQANDGTWQHYRVRLKEPEEKFAIRLANMHETEDGRMAMDLVVLANVEADGRQTLWEHGVQIYSLSAEADARIRLSARVEVATRLDVSRLPPDVVLDPEVITARFDIPDFRIRRISKANGPVVRSLSHTVREVLEEKLRNDNEKLVAKMNTQIAKQESKLRLSLADAVQNRLGGLLPKVP